MKVLIIGAGEIGAQVARFLVEERQDVVVVERDPGKARELGSHIDAAVIEGDGTDPEVLRRAGVASVGLVLSVTDHDVTNILASNIASVLAPEAIRLARIRNDSYTRDQRILDKNGIDIAINPEHLVVEKVAKLLTYRECIDYVSFEEGRVVIIAYGIRDDSPLAGLPLKDIRGRFPTPDFLIPMVIRGARAHIPDGDTVIAAGDRVYFLVLPGDLPDLQRMLGVPSEPVSHVFIHGGDYLAQALGRRLQGRKGLSLKIAHPDPAKCEALATELEHALVLHGDPADAEFLTDEYVDDQTVFVAAEHDEERNLLSAVLARTSGRGLKVIGVTNRSSYVPILSAVGLDVVLCPLNIAVTHILQYLRKGAVVQIGALETRDASAFEFVATEKLVGKPLHKLGLPRHVLIGAVLRDDEVLIPTGGTKIEAYDRLIVFAPRSHYTHLDRFFAFRGTR